MTLAPNANFDGMIKQVGLLRGPAQLVNGSSFVRDDGRLLHVGVGNRVVLYLSTLFSDYTIFSDPNFNFMGLAIGWAMTDFITATGKNFNARTFETNSQVISGVDPFGKYLYIQPEITIAPNPSFGDTQMQKMNWSFFEFPYDNPNAAPSGPPLAFGVAGLALPLVALGDFMMAWIRLDVNAGWPGFKAGDFIQIDAAIGANAS